MFERFRRGITKAIVGLLFGILILSFALWGIPNYNREAGNTAVADVAGREVGSQELQQLVERQRQLLSQEMGGQPLTRENARVVYKLRQRNMAADLERDALNALVDRAAVERHALELGLALSDQALAEGIRSDPVFQGTDKQFSRAIFNERLSSIGYTERRYFAERRADQLADKVAGALRDSVVAPDALVGVVHRFREETRTVAHFALDPTKVAKPTEPDKAKLEELYERIKSRFTEPERRRVTAAILSRDELKKLAPVDDAEVKAAWERDRASHDQPERRRWQQILFKTRAEAQEAQKEINGGKSMLVVALEAMGIQGRVDQGLIARREIGDGRLGSALFQLPVGKLSEPIEVRGGFALVRVNEIVPARERPFEEVAAEIRNELEQTRQREASQKVVDQLEDLRAQRKPLKDIAAELKLRLIDAAGIERNGKGLDGKAAIDHPDAERLLAAAFDQERSDRDAIDLSDGQAWIEVSEIVAAKVKPFDAVADEVKAAWLDIETRKAIQAAADAAAERLRKGEAVEAVAQAEGQTVEISEPFKRSQPVKGLSTSAVRTAFTLASGGVGTAETPDGKSRTVFVLREVKPAAEPTKEQADRIRDELRLQKQADTVGLYTAAVRQRFSARIDEAAYRRAIGSDQPQ